MLEEYYYELVLGFVVGLDGLDIVYKILVKVVDYLMLDGLLIVEVGNSWVVMDEVYLDLFLIWFEFENGGSGVFLVIVEVLCEW